MFTCPFCQTFEYSIPEGAFSPVRVSCPVCRDNFLHYLIRNICKQGEALELRAFLSCGIREEGERSVLSDFRERLYQIGVLPRTVGADPDSKVSSQTGALSLAQEEIQKADFILAVELGRYYVNGYLPSIWTLGIEPVLSFIRGKPIYVFVEKGVRLEGPLSEMALKVIEFDRNLLNYKTENERIDQWLQIIKSWEKERKQRKTSAFWTGGVLGAELGALIGSLFRGGVLPGVALGFIAGSTIGASSTK